MTFGFRKKRRPGNRPMTKAQGARAELAKTTLCIPCLVWATAGRMPNEDIATCSALDHKKSGNIRIGHDASFANCDWHHLGYPGDGWTSNTMRAHFGPSLMDGSRLFRDTYGTDAELIEPQNDVLGLAAA